MGRASWKEGKGDGKRERGRYNKGEVYTQPGDRLRKERRDKDGAWTDRERDIGELEMNKL